MIKLDQGPPIENNDEQDTFLKAPGFLVTEQHTPGQFNFSYEDLATDRNQSSPTSFGTACHSRVIGLVSLLFIICRCLKP